MVVNEISFDNLPNAVAHLIKELDSIKNLIEQEKSPQVNNQRVPIGIEQACKLIGKAKPTVYTLARLRKIPSYKKGKHLYFFEDELLEWIEKGRRKTLQEIQSDSENFLKRN